METELAKIDKKYGQQIEQYQKKGLNALSRKLIEKAQTEMAKAKDKKKVELESQL